MSLWVLLSVHLSPDHPVNESCWDLDVVIDEQGNRISCNAFLIPFEIGSRIERLPRVSRLHSTAS